MTREEAISVLNMVEAYGLADTAKQMAIEALSVDLVRCGECKYNGKANCAMKFKKPPTDYCSYGERRKP